VRESLTLYNPQHAGEPVRGLLMTVKAWLVAGHRVTLEAKTATRSSEQNARMWAMLGEVSAQVTWHGQKLTADEWKDVFSAALKRQKVVPGIDGGFVVIGARTSKMTVAEMCELHTLMEAFGAQQGVRFSAQEIAA